MAFMPHMHLRGKSFRYDATYADGTSEPLLDVPAYDFNWQSYYYLDRADRLPRPASGSTAWPTSTTRRPTPSTPTPGEAVTWGDQTWEEMMIGYVDVSFALPPEKRPRIGRDAEIGGGGE